MIKLTSKSKLYLKINKLQKGNKIGPTYDPKTKTWTNSKGTVLDIKKFYPVKNTTYVTLYTDDGYAVLWNTKDNKEFINARAGTGNRKKYIGGSPNLARQKYYDHNKEFTDSVKVIANRYNINPNLLASRIAKEGPIDILIKAHNKNLGYDAYNYIPELRSGMIWGLDDSSTDIKNGMEIKEPWVRDKLGEDEAINEKGRTVYPVILNKWSDGISVTAAELKMRRDYLKNKFPNLSENLLDNIASAAFNRGIWGAINEVKKGNLFEEYTPFILLK